MSRATIDPQRPPLDPAGEIRDRARPAMERATRQLRADLDRRSPFGIRATVRRTKTGVSGSVGTNDFRARFLEDGTGLYGVSRKPIRPKHRGRRALRTQHGPRASVRGIRGRQHFARAAASSRPYAERQLSNIDPPLLGERR